MNSAQSSASHRFKQLLIRGCIWFLYLFIVVEAIELLYGFIRALITHDDASWNLLMSTTEVAQFAPVFLGILIILELIETLEVYLQHHVVRIQLIIVVGLTAVTRHLLAADLKHGDSNLNLSMAALILALAGAYFLIERSAVNRTQT